MVQNIVSIALDADKIPSEQLIENYCEPPDTNESIMRNTLLVGTRGSGKTYFLRMQKHRNVLNGGIAYLGNLRNLIEPITSNLGAGGRASSEIQPAAEAPIQAKTVAIIAAWLSHNTLENGLKVPTNSLKHCLPNNMFTSGAINDEVIKDLLKMLQETDLSIFYKPPPISAFFELAFEIGETALQASKPLVILLDRLEYVPFPCLAPIFTLLDQSHYFKTIIATRPGVYGIATIQEFVSSAPGDHYDIRHLGVSPYSQAWNEYQKKTLKNWTPEATDSIPKDELTLLLKLGRDSIRNLIEIVHYDDVSGGYRHNETRKRLNRLRANLIGAAQGELRTINNNLKGLLRKFRKTPKPFYLPLHLVSGDSKQLVLFSPQPITSLTKSELFIDKALRNGFFVMPENNSWHPYGQINEVEVPPIIIWREGDPWFGPASTD